MPGEICCRPVLQPARNSEMKVKAPLVHYPLLCRFDLSKFGLVELAWWVLFCRFVLYISNILLIQFYRFGWVWVW